MISKKSLYKKIKIYSMYISGILIVVLFIIGFVEYIISEKKMEQVLDEFFMEAIIEEVELKMQSVYKTTNITSVLNVNTEQAIIQTIITDDIMITNEISSCNNIDNEFLKIYQSYLLLVNRLQSETLQHLLDKKLKEKKIKSDIFVLMQYDNENKNYSDILRYNRSYHTPIIHAGIYDEITYQAFFKYSYFTIFKLMSKASIIIISIILVLILVVNIFFNFQYNKIQPNKIIKKEKIFYIGETIFNLSTKELISSERKIKLTKQSHDLLVMFLENENHTLNKKVLIEEFWADNHLSAENNMSNAIYKLRNCLKSSKCTFAIFTKKGDDYYTLKYQN